MAEQEPGMPFGFKDIEKAAEFIETAQPTVPEGVAETADRIYETTRDNPDATWLEIKGKLSETPPTQ